MVNGGCKRCKKLPDRPNFHWGHKKLCLFVSFTVFSQISRFIITCESDLNFVKINNCKDNCQSITANYFTSSFSLSLYLSLSLIVIKIFLNNTIKCCLVVVVISCCIIIINVWVVIIAVGAVRPQLWPSSF